VPYRHALKVKKHWEYVKSVHNNIIAYNGVLSRKTGQVIKKQHRS